MSNKHKEVWGQSLAQEALFWRKWLSDPEYEPHRRTRLTPDRPIPEWMRGLIKPASDGPIRFLDLGSGPVSTIGDVWPGYEVEVFPVDPLADECGQILDELEIRHTVRPIRGHGETLLELFNPDFFDLAFSANALDHAYDPLACLQNMLTVVKRRCWTVIYTAVNEGQRQNYGGLHQWNLCVEDERVVIWNREMRIDALNSLPQAHGMRYERERNAQGKEMLRLFFQKG